MTCQQKEVFDGVGLKQLTHLDSKHNIGQDYIIGEKGKNYNTSTGASACTGNNLILIANIIESGIVAKTRMEVEQYGGQVSRKEDLWTPSAILDSISILFRFRLQILIELLSVQLCLLLPSTENKNRIILHQESVSQMGSCLDSASWGLLLHHSRAIQTFQQI